MYCQFYGFRDKPFSLLPDPEFLFLSRKHEKALNLLELGILNQSGFCVISGEIGAGKTTLVRELLNRLDEQVRVGLISNTHSAFSDLLGWVLAAYELKSESEDAATRHRCFTDFIIEQYAAGKHTLLIIDEAQNLSLSALEQLRMLSNINAEKDLVLQIILVGQSELRTKLQQPELEQFAQRIAIDYHLAALDQEETAAYMRHRVAVSGGSQQLFDDAACRLIYQYSKGIPRLINRICDLSLVYGFARDKKIIDASLIKAVTEDQEAGQLSKTSAEKDTGAKAVKPPAKETEVRPAKTANTTIYAAAEKATTEKTTAEFVATEKSSVFRTEVENSKTDAALAEKAETEKLVAEKLAAEKGVAEKAAAAQAEASIAAAKLAESEQLTVKKTTLKITSEAEQATDLAAKKKQTADKLVAEKARIENEALEIACALKREAGKALEERIVAEKAAAEKVAVADENVRKATATRVAAEKVAAGMVSDSETAAQRAISRQVDATHAIEEKTAASKAAAEKAHADSALASKTAAESIAAKTAAREKLTAAKQAAQKASASSAKAEMALAEQAAADTLAKEKVSLEKIALAKVAVSAAAAAQQEAVAAAAARTAAEKEAREKEAAAEEAARRAVKANALAEKAKAAAENRIQVDLSELSPDKASDKPPAATPPQVLVAIQAKQHQAAAPGRTTRAVLALSFVAGIMAASLWLVTRPDNTATDTNPSVAAGKSYTTPGAVTEAAALETAGPEPAAR